MSTEQQASIVDRLRGLRGPWLGDGFGAAIHRDEIIDTIARLTAERDAARAECALQHNYSCESSCCAMVDSSGYRPQALLYVHGAAARGDIRADQGEPDVTDLPAPARDPRDAIIVELLMGLTTDGAHHKQYSLERVFRMLCEDAYVDRSKERLGWESGVAP